MQNDGITYRKKDRQKMYNRKIYKVKDHKKDREKINTQRNTENKQ